MLMIMVFPSDSSTFYLNYQMWIQNTQIYDKNISESNNNKNTTKIYSKNSIILYIQAQTFFKIFNYVKQCKIITYQSSQQLFN